MTSMTREYTKRVKQEIKFIDDRMKLLHKRPKRSPQPDYNQRKSESVDLKQEALIDPLALSQSLSYRKTLLGEQSLANFWRRVFPISRGRKGVIHILTSCRLGKPAAKKAKRPHCVPNT
eukprot:6203366-Pleurochrysis_carterae.AAC.1